MVKPHTHLGCRPYLRVKVDGIQKDGVRGFPVVRPFRVMALAWGLHHNAAGEGFGPVGEEA